jgi:hypothetical protein
VFLCGHAVQTLALGLAYDRAEVFDKMRLDSGTALFGCH